MHLSNSCKITYDSKTFNHLLTNKYVHQTRRANTPKHEACEHTKPKHEASNVRRHKQNTKNMFTIYKLKKRYNEYTKNSRQISSSYVARRARYANLKSKYLAIDIAITNIIY